MKHAYLIMAHNEFELLKYLLKMLDDNRNDIYLHIDKKTKVNSKLRSELQKCCKLSNVFILKSIKVTWGGDSMINCELYLLKEAFRNGYYDYFHLLSGVDLPIKTQDYIHAFFEKYKNKSFIDIDPNYEKYIDVRIGKYILFQNITGRDDSLLIRLFKKFENLSVKIQKNFNIKRSLKNNMIGYKGSNWFSITNEMAKYMLESEKIIKKYFYHSICADEVFLQTIAYNSRLKDMIINNDLRYIDWNRGGPYTFEQNDFEELLASTDLFARKFSCSKSNELVKKIYDHFT